MAIVLDRTERRVIGVLIEKALSTPDLYPLTANALTAGCNQKNNRDPVISVAEFEIDGVLKALFIKGLVAHANKDGGRAPRFAHRIDKILDLDTARIAVVAELLLRGPQTVGELRTHTERMWRFDSLEQVTAVLEELARRPEPLVQLLARAPGERAPKWRDLLGDAGGAAAAAVESAAPAPEAADPVPAPRSVPAPAPQRPAASWPGSDDLSTRIDRLEAEVRELRAMIASLRGGT